MHTIRAVALLASFCLACTSGDRVHVQVEWDPMEVRFTTLYTRVFDAEGVYRGGLRRSIVPSESGRVAFDVVVDAQGASEDAPWTVEAWMVVVDEQPMEDTPCSLDPTSDECAPPEGAPHGVESLVSRDQVVLLRLVR